MESANDTLRFYTQFVTGMVLLLNIALLISIRLNMKLSRGGITEGRPKPPGKGLLAGLMITVIVVNGAALFANHKLRQAAEGVLVEAGLLEPPAKAAAAQ